MDHFSIQCFLAVVSLKSFTKAAQKVGRTQSAVTQQIASLEKQLDVKLFERGKQLSLTKDGQLFLPYADKLDALHQELLDRFKHPELDGQIRFGVPEDFATVLLSDVLTEFSRSHPRIFLNVECDLSVHLFNKFKEGLLDLVLLKMISPKDFPQGVSVWKEPLVWVGSTCIMHEIKEKKRLPLVLAPDPCVYKKATLEALAQSDLDYQVVYTSPSHAGIIAAVKAGLGITVLPITMVPSGLERLIDPVMPALCELHVSLLCQDKASLAVESMKKYLNEQILKRFTTSQ